MSALSSSPTRVEAMRLSSASDAGVRFSPVGGGIEVSDVRLGVWVLPLADGRLGFKVIGEPALTGFKDACSLLQTDARTDFSPAAVRLDGEQLRCLEPCDLAPMLSEGFTLTLASAMATILAHWLPRLVHVAALAHQIARRVEAQLAPAPTAHGVDVCAEIAAAVVLDQLPVDVALLASHHWTLAEPAWRAAFNDPAVRQLLEAAGQDIGTRSSETARSAAPTGDIHGAARA